MSDAARHSESQAAREPGPGTPVLGNDVTTLRLDLDRERLESLDELLAPSATRGVRRIELVLPVAEPLARSFRNGTPARSDLPSVLDAVRPLQRFRAAAAARDIEVRLEGFARGIFDGEDPAGPVTAMVEVSSRCNLRCPTCSVGRRALARHNDMAPALFERAIEGLAPTVARLALYNLGEPLMHPELPALIEHAKAAGIPEVFVSTNLGLHAPARIEALVRAGIDEIVVSLDGVSEESYRTFRIGGSLERVLHNLAIVDRERRRRSDGKPRVRLQFLLFRHNLHEREAMRELARRFGVGFEIKAAMVPSHAEGWLPLDADVPRRSAEADHGWCCRPYHHTTILSDGMVVPCCKDSGGRHPLGDLRDERWPTIWTGARYRALRAAMLADKSALSLCKSCPGGWFTSSTVLEQERDPWPS